MKLTDYLYQAIALEESGKKVELKKSAEYAIPDELPSRLDDDARFSGPPSRL